jgi:AbrB family looped-hinge helix DNA binding protein
METAKAKVSGKGWVVIPKPIREAMGLKPGDEVRFLMSPGSGAQPALRVVKISTDVRSLRGKYRGEPGERTWTEELLEERRRDREREERKVNRPPAKRRRAG